MTLFQRHTAHSKGAAGTCELGWGMGISKNRNRLNSQMWAILLIIRIWLQKMKFWTKEPGFPMPGVDCHLSHCLAGWRAGFVKHAAYFLFGAKRPAYPLGWVLVRHSQILLIYISEYSRWLSQMFPQNISQVQTDAALSGAICVPRSTNYFTQYTQA